LKKTVIIDYGLGNLRSVLRGLERAGAAVAVTADPEEIMAADGVVLPGVGAFREGMEMLGDLRETVVRCADEIPMLGICLGMQMLMESSEEHGLHQGLGLVPGTVKRFPHLRGSSSGCESNRWKVPHMGWNTIRITRDDPLFEGLHREEYLYFVHSYYVRTTAHEDTLATTDYILPFSSAVCNRQTYGVQFHPEKSGETGLRILRNFIELL